MQAGGGVAAGGALADGAAASICSSQRGASADPSSHRYGSTGPARGGRTGNRPEAGSG